MLGIRNHFYESFRKDLYDTHTTWTEKKIGLRVVGAIELLAVEVFETIAQTLYTITLVAPVAIKVTFTVVNCCFGKNHSSSVYVRENFAGLSTLFLNVIKTLCCFITIIGAPALILASPSAYVASYNLFGFERFTSKPKKKEEKIIEVSNHKGFKSVVGFEKLKEEIKSKFINPLDEKYQKRAKLLKGDNPFIDIRINNGLLFYGPPGTGKTFLAKKIAEELDAPFFAPVTSDIVDCYVGESERKIKEIFKEAFRSGDLKGKAVLFFDEIDAYLPKRTGGKQNSQHDHRMVITFLQHLNECARHHVIVIGATNRRDSLDEASIRNGRFDCHIEIPLPDKETLTSLLKAHMKGLSFSEDFSQEDQNKWIEKASSLMSEKKCNAQHPKLVVENAISICLKSSENVALQQEQFDQALKELMVD